MWERKEVQKEGWGGLKRASSFRMRKPGTNRVGWRHSLHWGPGLPGPSRWTPKALSSGYRPKNPCAKPSANPGQRRVPTPRPLRSIGREGVCRSAEAGPKDQPGRQRECWSHQPPQQDVPTWGGDFVLFTAVPQNHSGQSIILTGWMNESLKGTRSLKSEGEAKPS